MTCLNCDGELHEQVVDFSTEVKGQQVVFSMSGLVCAACGYHTVRGEEVAEYMRRAADVYRAQNNLLTSDEIRLRRKSLGMNQEQFAAHLGVGVASVKRWEWGQIQDKALDNLIRIRTSVDDAKANYWLVSEMMQSLAIASLLEADSLVPEVVYYPKKTEVWQTTANLASPAEHLRVDTAYAS